MRKPRWIVLAAFGVLAQPASAQGVAVVDLNARPAAFSEADYQALLGCTLERHPDETRRYAEYHLFRRNTHTPRENEADPDSRLMLPIIQDCFEIEVGKPFPFSFDALIADWGKAHNLFANASVPGPMRVRTSEDLAKCAVAHHPAVVSQILAMQRPLGAVRHLGELMGPLCDTGNDFKVNVDAFYAELDRQAAAKEGAR